MQPSEPCDWSGWYVGFNTGGSFDHFDIGSHTGAVNLTQQFYDITDEIGAVESSAFASFDFPGHNPDNTQAIGGGQTGFNFQFGHLVIGAEGGFSGNHGSARERDVQFQENSFFISEEEEEVTADTLYSSKRTAEIIWNAFIGGHVGFAWNRLFFYVAGGASFCDLHVTENDMVITDFFGEGEPERPNSSLRATVSPRQGENFIGEAIDKRTNTHGDVLTGYYVGTGTDYMLFKNVSMGVEYRHAGWGNINEGFNFNGPLFPGNTNYGVSADQIMFKVNIMIAQFNPFH
jgi:opacity protein-like surface antigen